MFCFYRPSDLSDGDLAPKVRTFFCIFYMSGILSTVLLSMFRWMDSSFEGVALRSSRAQYINLQILASVAFSWLECVAGGGLSFTSLSLNLLNNCCSMHDMHLNALHAIKCSFIPYNRLHALEYVASARLSCTCQNKWQTLEFFAHI